MMRMRMTRSVLTAAAAALPLSAVGVLATSTNAFGYGAADHPIAQVEISGNCDNPAFALCAPPTQNGVGLGGVWVWSELDTTTGNITSGTMDATVTFCGHGTGHPGAFGHPDHTGVWVRYASLTTAEAATAGHAQPFYNPATYHGSVDVLDFFPHTTPATDFVAVVPTQQGHYSEHPAPAVSIQLQVAP